MNGLPTAFCVVLILKTVLDDLELKLSHGTDYLSAIELVDEQLRHTFVHQLVDAFLQLLRLHGVVVLDILEHLRRERGKSAEVEFFTLGECIANLENAIVGQTNDVAWPCFFDGALALGHELGGGGEAQGLVVANVQIRLVADELSRAYLAEGNTRAMVRVDVSRYFEDESRELRLFGLYHAFLGFGGTRTRGNLYETVEQFLHTEII